LEDISQLSDSSFEAVKQFDEDFINLPGDVTIESSVTSQIAGVPAQKIVYTEPGIGNEKFKNMEVNVLAYDKEYKITYQTAMRNIMINYDKYFSTFIKMLNTFTVSKPA
jgi:hypothetical protein